MSQLNRHYRRSEHVKTLRRRRFSNVRKKPYCFTSRHSKIKLPTRFLLGGTIEDPLNLQSLENESDDQSESCSDDKMNSQLLIPKPTYMYCFPLVTDTSDPLGLKNVLSTDVEKLSNDCTACMEENKDSWSVSSSKNYCHTSQMTDKDPRVENCLCDTSSSEMKIELPVPINQYDDQLSSPNLNTGSTFGANVPLAEKSTSVKDTEMYDARVVDDTTINVRCRSDGSQPKAASGNKFTDRDKIVSPAVPQFPSHKVRKRRHKSRQTSKAAAKPVVSSQTTVCNKRKNKFPRGNYVAYYGYRNIDSAEDPRLLLFSKELFEGKDVLDIGCNAGIVTIAVAVSFVPKIILGMDVDQRLIAMAKKNVRHVMDKTSYPSCLKNAFGPLAVNPLPSMESDLFPHNILFQVGDYVPSSDADVARQCAEYDVILALSVTKWIHLTHGDVGLQRMFLRMFRQLRPGGNLILEAQPWPSYKRKKKLTEKIFEVYQSICFKPEEFNDYLLSAEVGFSSCQLLGTPEHKSKGFQRAIYVFTKSSASASTSSSTADL